ncbi:MAG: type II glyceraldehyde-3-phosphate dehydrogenase, partial [Acidimicrobiia bacterium]|nr:type II glyceraldehyde-3-phosphate dehydrogenase [Acidimicrobiia bacterium]MDX2468405.1 type II glyceraldehyde-3-phosphate dehydrogenase [Acidimicrobiia bacterium]
MSKVKVGVAGYGTIGNRLAAGVARQEDMELVGVADVAPTLAVRALKERGMPFKLFTAYDGAEKGLEEAGIPVSGGFDDLLGEVDIMLDAAPGGIGAKNKEKYVAAGVKAVFQGGEAGEVADVFFHGTVNYEKGLGVDYLKLTSCNTTGLIR